MFVRRSKQIDMTFHLLIGTSCRGEEVGIMMCSQQGGVEADPQNEGSEPMRSSRVPPRKMRER